MESSARYFPQPDFLFFEGRSIACYEIGTVWSTRGALYDQPKSQGDFVKENWHPEQIYDSTWNNHGDMERNADYLKSNRDHSDPCKPKGNQTSSQQKIGKKNPTQNEAELAKPV